MIAKIERNLSNILHTSEGKIMNVLEGVMAKLTNHDRCLAKLAEKGPDPQSAQPSAEWTKVVKKHRKQSVNPTQKPLVPAAPQSQSLKPPRKRPAAIFVKKGDESFPELLKTVRQRIDPKDTGNSITRIREYGMGASHRGTRRRMQSEERLSGRLDSRP